MNISRILAPPNNRFPPFLGKPPRLLGFLWGACLWGGLTCSAAWAEIGYGVDDCRIIMRRGPATGFKIVQMLRVGEEMKILKSDVKSGWDRVRSKAGLEGWVLHRFVSKEPPPKIQLERHKQARRQAEEALVPLRLELEKLRKQVRSQEKLEAELARIRSISKNTLDIERQKEALSKKVRNMKNEREELIDDNKFLKRQADTSFFLSGAMVLVVGLISGAVLSRRRRTPSFGSL